LRAADFFAADRLTALLRVTADLRVAAAFVAAADRFAAVFLAEVAFLAVVLGVAGAGGQVPRASLGAWLGVTTASLKPFNGVMRAFFEALILTG